VLLQIKTTQYLQLHALRINGQQINVRCVSFFQNVIKRPHLNLDPGRQRQFRALFAQVGPDVGLGRVQVGFTRMPFLVAGQVRLANWNFIRDHVSDAWLPAIQILFTSIWAEVSSPQSPNATKEIMDWTSARGRFWASPACCRESLITAPNRSATASFSPARLSRLHDKTCQKTNPEGA
jgi:hypothetical protein